MERAVNKIRIGKGLTSTISKMAYRLSTVDHWILFDDLFVTKHHALDDGLDVLIGPDAQKNALRSTSSFRSKIGATVHRRAKHVVDSVGVEHERRVGDVVLSSSLRQRQSFFQHAEYGLGHGFRSPRFQRTAFPEPHVLHEVLAVPTLLPH